MYVKSYFLTSLSLLILLVVSSAFSSAAQLSAAQTPEPQTPVLHAASGDAQSAIKQFKLAPDLKCELFAAEPDVANIVAFHRDYTGRMFVCETYRQANDRGVEDNRSHANWMDEELSAQTIQDRIDYIRKYVPDADRLYTANDDRIRLLVDTDGDGVSDRSTVFAKGFNRIEMGTGAGVLSYRDRVYFTCIPDLISLADTDNDNAADQREVLHTGFGVRFAFRGHDMHGLIVGPDGRLYFSIGDRGYDVSPAIHNVTSGAVFRCELDGSNLEVVATGFRNPQELAFDDHGNLFTGDNNSDSGDKARWVYVVPGGDSGWRMYYQYLPDRGPFNREKIWYPFNADTPAYIVPPIDNLGDGPSGLEYYPGTGFGDDFAGRFFLCDFRGTPNNSGIRSFRNEQVGAFWKVVDAEQPVWGVLPTDLDFGSDGKLYVSDWVMGWVGENKGRIYAIHDEEKFNSPLVKEVQSLLAGALPQKTSAELKMLLGHVDQRVRQEAQFELVSRKEWETLKSVALAAAETQTAQLARIHAIWGLNMMVRLEGNQLSASTTTNSTATNSTATSRREVDRTQNLISIAEKLLADGDSEIRAQAAQLVGDASLPISNAVVPLLRDKNLRVRYFAAMALSKIGDVDSLGPIATMLVENRDADPILRHGGIMAFQHGLKKNGDDAKRVDVIKKLAEQKSPSVRRALCVAVRKCFTDPNPDDYNGVLLENLLNGLLSDSDRDVRLEAARVVYDVPVNGLMSQLASQISGIETELDGSLHDDALLRRVIQANFRVGSSTTAFALSDFAANSKLPVERRAEALTALSNWLTPSNNDPLLNDWRPVDSSSRNLADAQTALVKNFGTLAKETDPISSLAIAAVGKLKATGIDHQLEQVVLADAASGPNRTAALNSLIGLESTKIHQLTQQLSSNFDQLPTELAALVAETVSQAEPKRGIELVQRIFAKPETPIETKQNLIAKLGSLSDPASATWMRSAWDQMKDYEFPEQLRLDLILASEQRSEAELKKAAADYRTSKIGSQNPSDKFWDTLYGGNEARGKEIFVGKMEVSCIRCHKCEGEGGEVGPDLSGVAIKHDRQYILDSIVQPNKIITEGYGQIKVLTMDGILQTGLLVSENEKEIRLLDADGNSIIIPQDEVDEIKPGLSAMPDDLIKHLSERELRDLIEYLINRKTEPTPIEAAGHDG